MKFTTAQYEQLFSTYSEFLELLVASNSYLSQSAVLALQKFTKPNFKDDYWPKFNTQFKKTLASAYKYSLLDGEDEQIQLKLKRLLPILMQILPIEFIEHYKKYYLDINGETLAKFKLQDTVREFLEDLNPMFRYRDTGSNDFVAKFDLVSVDGKQTINVYATLDRKDDLVIDVGGFYKDLDFEFEVEELRFDMLQFQTLQNCVNHIMAKLALKASMKINGTRFRIGNNVFLISARDLTKCRAELLLNGSTRLYSLQGEIIFVNTSGKGKLVDKIAVRLLLENTEAKLYYIIEEQHNIVVTEEPDKFLVETLVTKRETPTLSVKSVPSTVTKEHIAQKTAIKKSVDTNKNDDYEEKSDIKNEEVDPNSKSNIKLS